MPTPSSSQSSPIDHAPASATLLSAAPPPRRFTKEQEGFLFGLLPNFNAYLDDLAKEGTGPRGTKGIKGKQVEWLKSFVLDQFIEHFNLQKVDRVQLTTVRIRNQYINCFTYTILEIKKMVLESRASCSQASDQGYRGL